MSIIYIKTLYMSSKYLTTCQLFKWSHFFVKFGFTAPVFLEFPVAVTGFPVRKHRFPVGKTGFPFFEFEVPSRPVSGGFHRKPAGFPFPDSGGKAAPNGNVNPGRAAPSFCHGASLAK